MKSFHSIQLARHRRAIVDGCRIVWPRAFANRNGAIQNACCIGISLFRERHLRQRIQNRREVPISRTRRVFHQRQCLFRKLPGGLRIVHPQHSQGLIPQHHRGSQIVGCHPRGLGKCPCRLRQSAAFQHPLRFLIESHRRVIRMRRSGENKWEKDQAVHVANLRRIRRRIHENLPSAEIPSANENRAIRVHRRKFRVQPPGDCRPLEYRPQ